MRIAHFFAFFAIVQGAPTQEENVQVQNENNVEADFGYVSLGESTIRGISQFLSAEFRKKLFPPKL